MENKGVEMEEEETGRDGKLAGLAGTENCLVEGEHTNRG